MPGQVSSLPLLLLVLCNLVHLQARLARMLARQAGQTGFPVVVSHLLRRQLRPGSSVWCATARASWAR